MSEENGFVERPVTRPVTRRGPGLRMRRLIETADNGKAIPWTGPAIGGGYWGTLNARGLRAHVSKIPDGTYVAWCERIEPQK